MMSTGTGKSRPVYQKMCARCQKEMWILAHKWHARRYCSRKCASLASRTRSEIVLTCSQCQNSFTRVKKTSSIHGKYFCTRKCKDIAQSLDGNCPEIRPAHYGSSLSYSRFKKDQCEGCSETRAYLLMVHHIDSDRSNNTEENLETVCANCHVIRHLHQVGNTWKFSSKVLTPRELISSFTYSGS